MGALSAQTCFKTIVTTKALNPETIHDCMRFRKQLFVEVRGWDLPTQGDLEIDAFDHDDAEYAVICFERRIVGCFRAIRTDAPYLAAEVFPDLAASRSYPHRRDFWEISRFGIMPGQDRFLRRELAVANYALMFEFARRRQARALVAIADLTYERFLRKLGVITRRYGPPVDTPIGRDGTIPLVAGEIPVGDARFSLPEKITDALNLMEIRDEVADSEFVLGRRGLSA